MHESQQCFLLKNSSKNFVERQKNIFGQLNSLKCNLEKDEAMDVEPSRTKNRDRVITKQFRGKESIFKVPQDPVSYMKTIPDFKKNPHKWTKYSLDDVKEEDMSDSSNTKAALMFLSELQKNRSNKDESDDSPQAPKKILFKKTPPNSLCQDETEVKPSFRSSKLVMPEYTVGQKIKKEKKKRKNKIINCSQLRLDHLHEDD